MKKLSEEFYQMADRISEMPSGMLATRYLPMTAPITYIPNFITDPDRMFKELSEELDWEKRGNTPRQEYYCNDIPNPYVYGVGEGRRRYDPKPWHKAIEQIRSAISAHTGTIFEVCFLNRYLDQKDHLGWHADDSPEMDDARPIAIVSLGVEREIWFRKFIHEVCALCIEPIPNHKTPDCRGPEIAKKKTIKLYTPEEKIKLGHGSLCLMHAGMQEEWFHRIPKCSHICGERISLTFRGYIDPSGESK